MHARRTSRVIGCVENRKRRLPWGQNGVVQDTNSYSLVSDYSLEWWLCVTAVVLVMEYVSFQTAPNYERYVALNSFVASLSSAVVYCRCLRLLYPQAEVLRPDFHTHPRHPSREEPCQPPYIVLSRIFRALLCRSPHSSRGQTDVPRKSWVQRE